MKNLIKFAIISLILMFVVLINVSGKEGQNLIGLTIDGQAINYKGTTVQVQTPDAYTKTKFDMRAVWVTPISGDIKINTEANFRSELDEVFETMRFFNLNTLVFHIRSHNDAYYPSLLNPKSTRVLNIDFNTFDPLEWVIKRCHEEGFEFHAWLNPYRATAFPSSYYPDANPAKDLANTLSTRDGIILNPGIPLVREFLVDTVMEIIENYDVDAIHFDDYFYAGGIDDTATRAIYNKTGLGVADWRRLQVDNLIEMLSTEMRAYNIANNRRVQLGIAPTGVYRTVASRAQAISGTYDAHGNYSVVGSNNSGCQEHYGAALYADTKKWVDNEWIDYIAPQTYWSFMDRPGGFADLVEWWAYATAKKNVNLYASMGIYMSQGSWRTNTEEAPMQVIYSSQFESVRGTFIYKYGELKAAKNGVLSTNAINGNNLKTLWDYEALTPEIRTMPSIALGQVANFKQDGNRLSWNNLDGAKRYAIYRSETNAISQTVDELLTVAGNINGFYIDETADLNKTYTYAISPISASNTEGDLAYSTQGAVTIPAVINVEIVTVFGKPSLKWKNILPGEIDRFEITVNRNYSFKINELINEFELSYFLKTGTNNISFKAFKGSEEIKSSSLTYLSNDSSNYVIKNLRIEESEETHIFKWERGCPVKLIKEIIVFVNDKEIEKLSASDLQYDISDALLIGDNTVSLRVMDIYDNAIYEDYTFYTLADTAIPVTPVAPTSSGCKASAVNLLFVFVGLGFLFIKRKESI